MTEEEGNHDCKFCCIDCFAYVESECFCDRILGIAKICWYLKLAMARHNIAQIRLSARDHKFSRKSK